MPFVRLYVPHFPLYIVLTIVPQDMQEHNHKFLWCFIFVAMLAYLFVVHPILVAVALSFLVSTGVLVSLSSCERFLY
jgi:hypothetical protein